MREFDYREFNRQMGTLALTPITKIDEALKLLEKNRSDEIGSEQLINYLQTYRIDQIGADQRNHYNTDGHRTTNFCEGFHSKLNRLIGNKYTKKTYKKQVINKIKKFQ